MKFQNLRRKAPLPTPMLTNRLPDVTLYFISVPVCRRCTEFAVYEM